MSQIVQSYYEDFAQGEWERLQDAYTTFEFTSTLRLIDKYITGESIIDVGSGPGMYAIEMMKRGKRTSLWDFSKPLLNIAEEKIAEAGFEAEEIICKDALHLVDHEKEYDGLLLMGPMYHVHGEEKRKKVMEGVKKVLKKDGVALVAFLNSWGVLRAGMHEFAGEFAHEDLLRRYLGSFERSVDAPNEKGFTDIFLTTPPEAKEFLEECGFEVVSYAGVEGFAAGMAPHIEWLAEEIPAAYENIKKVLPECIEEHPFRDTTEHTVFVIRNS